MPIVLVVDDSPVDQKLVGGLLSRDIEWLVEFADDVDSALSMIADISPDIVITDLQMPGKSGIELVKIGRKKFPHIPVVLITGQGSEELAVHALEAGASSYVPKSALAASLNDTVNQMLALAEKDKNKDRLMNFTTNCRYQFKMDSDPKLIPPLIEFVADTMKLMKVGDLVLIRHIAVAIEEALVNALFHGNLELAQSHAHAGRHAEPDSQEFKLVEDRMKMEPYNSRKIFFGMDVSRSKAQFAIRDQGPGFDVKSLPDLSSSSNLTDTTARGLTLISNFMDEVKFNDEGNEIRLALNLAVQSSSD